jgi:hypothetical protein
MVEKVRSERERLRRGGELRVSARKVGRKKVDCGAVARHE